MSPHAKYRPTIFISSVQLDDETEAIVRKKRRQGWKLSPWVRQKIKEEFGETREQPI